MISIIMPVYNSEKYILAMLQSIYAQKYKDYELILIDDGSTDNSLKIASSYLNNTEIKYRIIRTENRGQSSARNVGISNALGEWIVLPDSDDALSPDYLDKLIRSATSNNCEIAICNIKNIPAGFGNSRTTNSNVVQVLSGRDAYEKFIMHKLAIGPYNVLIQRNLLIRLHLKFIEECRYSEEYIFISELLVQANKVVSISDELYYYYKRPQSVITSARTDRIVSGFQYIKKYTAKYSCLSPNYRKYALARWIIATFRICSGRMSYKDYRVLLRQFSVRSSMVKLLTFPDRIIQLLALSFLISPFFSYCALRIIENRRN
jgi:glycosyltransferase involved in cell wall biosynthesis